jgi:hypothetical protein
MAKTSKTKAKARSGYARDIMPERLDAAERNGLTVPVGLESGGQVGHLLPGQRKYAANYKSVSMHEAEMNLHARTVGEMPPIKGGLDIELPDEVAKGLHMAPKSRVKTVASQQDYDPLGDGKPIVELEPGSAELEAEEKRLAQLRGPDTLGAQTATQSPVIIPTVWTDTDPKSKYLATRRRVSLETPDGIVSMLAIDVKESPYSVTILLPLQTEGVTFIPKPGLDVTVCIDQCRWRCYFPATYFEVAELGILGLVFVKADEQPHRQSDSGTVEGARPQ